MPSSQDLVTAAPSAFPNDWEEFSETQNSYIFPHPIFPAARYQNELAGVDTELLAERFYYQALSVAPQIGKWTPDGPHFARGR